MGTTPSQINSPVDTFGGSTSLPTRPELGEALDRGVYLMLFPQGDMGYIRQNECDPGSGGTGLA
jgi:hypothetical protein